MDKTSWDAECFSALEKIQRIDRALDSVRCRFGCTTPVIGIYWMPRGCACHPDQVQALCAQHAVKAEPLAGMTLICGPGLTAKAGQITENSP